MSNEKIAAHEFKEHTQHVEHAHDGTGLGGLQRPAVMLTPEEEAKLYRKVSLSEFYRSRVQGDSDLLATTKGERALVVVVDGSRRLLGPMADFLPALVSSSWIGICFPCLAW